MHTEQSSISKKPKPAGVQLPNMPTTIEPQSATMVPKPPVIIPENITLSNLHGYEMNVIEKQMSPSQRERLIGDVAKALLDSQEEATAENIYHYLAERVAATVAHGIKDTMKHRLHNTFIVSFGTTDASRRRFENKQRQWAKHGLAIEEAVGKRHRRLVRLGAGFLP